MRLLRRSRQQTPEPTGPPRRPDAGGAALIGAGLTIAGEIRGDIDLVVAGRIDGPVTCSRLEVWPGGVVDGDVKAAEAVIAGALRGAIEAQRIDVAKSGGIEGFIENDGDCRIDGQVEGDINSRRLVVGQGAVVEARVTADDATIDGMVDGPIEAINLTLGETGKILGDISSTGDVVLGGQVHGDTTARSIIVLDGAAVRGQLHANTIEIAGSVTGEVTAVSVEIKRTGEVTGSVVHHNLRIAPGGMLRGSRPWRPKGYLEARGI